jgi:hypothetical protein
MKIIFAGVTGLPSSRPLAAVRTQSRRFLAPTGATNKCVRLRLLSLATGIERLRPESLHQTTLPILNRATARKNANA